MIKRIRLELESTATENWEERIKDADKDQPSLRRLCRQLIKKGANILADHLGAQFQPNPTRLPERHYHGEGTPPA